MKRFLALILAAALAARREQLWFAQGRCRTTGPERCRGRGEVLTRAGHEAFAETVTSIPSRASWCRSAAGRHRGIAADQRGPTSRGSPATGAGTTSEAISFGSAASGAPCRPVANGCPGIGASPAQGFQWTSGYWADAKASEVEYLPEPPATVEVGPNIAASSADQTWLPGCWVWQQNRYAWRPGFWATVAAELGLGPRPLRLGPARLRLRRRLLGLLDRPSRRAVCAGLFRCGRVHAAGFLLLADDGDRPGRVRQPSLLAAAVPTLLFRRLLRRQLPRRGVLPVVFDQHRAFRLRSDLRSPALAASAGPRMGTTPTGGLPRPPRSRGSATAAHMGGPERNGHACGTSRREEPRGRRAT